MLFDLRGRGRRRTVQAVYLSLALLLGGGLVLFGIGGEVSGGLVDGLRGDGTDVNEQVEDRINNAEARTKANPRDAGAYAELAQARYQLAGQSEGFNETATDPAQRFTGKARQELEAAERAWDRHLEVAGDRPNVDTAGVMRNALLSLGKADKAVRAQEILLDGRPNPGYGDYAALADLAYQAGQTRKGDLAARRATELAPRNQREQLEQQLQQSKAQAATGGGAAGGAAGAGGGAPAVPTPTPAPSGG